MNRTIVSIGGDPGGAGALVATVQALAARQDVTVVSYTYNEATAIFAEHGLPHRMLTGEVGDRDVAALLHADGAASVLAATSCNGVDLEKRFVTAARAYGIPSVAVLDFWSGYACRFSDADGRPTCAADVIAVMDERAREEVAALGVERDRIVITGQPAFDALADERRTLTAERRLAIRRRLGASPADLLVVFVSQPLASLYAASEGDPRFLGYDEQEVMAAVVAAIDALRATAGRRIRLVIRRHPREDAAAFARYETPDMSASAAESVSGRECVSAADLVVGMNSALLLEACYLGALVLSVQPGLRRRDMLPTNEWGVSEGVFRRDDVDVALARLLLDERRRAAMRARLRALQLQSGAAQRVAGCVVAGLRHAAGSHS